MIVLLGLLLPLATFAQQAVCPTIWNRGAPYFCTEREVQNGALGNGTYNKLVPPVEKFRVPVDVKMGLNVYKLVNLDIQAAQIDLSVWIRLSWTDKRLAWDTNTYNVSQTSYYASNSNEESVIWVPDLEMYNQERSVYECADKQAMVYPSGFVFWSRPCIVSALCSFNELSKVGRKGSGVVGSLSLVALLAPCSPPLANPLLFVSSLCCTHTRAPSDALR